MPILSIISHTVYNVNNFSKVIKKFNKTIFQTYQKNLPFREEKADRIYLFLFLLLKIKNKKLSTKQPPPIANAYMSKLYPTSSMTFNAHLHSTIASAVDINNAVATA